MRKKTVKKWSTQYFIFGQIFINFCLSPIISSPNERYLCVETLRIIKKNSFRMKLLHKNCSKLVSLKKIEKNSSFKLFLSDRFVWFRAFKMKKESPTNCLPWKKRMKRYVSGKRRYWCFSESCKIQKKIYVSRIFWEFMSVTILKKPENDALGMYETIGIQFIRVTQTWTCGSFWTTVDQRYVCAYIIFRKTGFLLLLAG